MDFLLYLFNIGVILCYALTFGCTLIVGLREKNPKRKHFFATLTTFVGITFLSELILSVPEVLTTVSELYNIQFKGFLALGNVIFTIINFLLLTLLFQLIERRIPWWYYVYLVSSFVIMTILPLLPTSHLMVYLYYLPNQIFLFWLGITSFKNKKESGLFSHIEAILTKLFALLVIGSLGILIEDTIVIFWMDDYFGKTMSIQNRNFTETVVYLLLLALIIWYDIRYLMEETITTPTNTTIDLAVTSPAKTIDDFFEKYHLTQRESEICRLVLDHQDNQTIANTLFLSLGTVKTHIHNIFAKMDIHHRRELFELYRTFQNDES